MLTLPQAVLRSILRYCDFGSVKSLSVVCKHIKQVAQCHLFRKLVLFGWDRSGIRRLAELLEHQLDLAVSVTHVSIRTLAPWVAHNPARPGNLPAQADINHMLGLCRNLTSMYLDLRGTCIGGKRLIVPSRISHLSLSIGTVLDLENIKCSKLCGLDICDWSKAVPYSDDYSDDQSETSDQSAEEGFEAALAAGHNGRSQLHADADAAATEIVEVKSETLWPILAERVALRHVRVERSMLLLLEIVAPYIVNLEIHSSLIWQTDFYNLLAHCGHSLKSYSVLDGPNALNGDVQRYRPRGSSYSVQTIPCPHLESITVDYISTYSMPFWSLPSLRRLTLRGYCYKQTRRIIDRLHGDCFPQLVSIKFSGPVYAATADTAADISLRMTKVIGKAIDKGITVEADQVVQMLKVMEQRHVEDVAASQAEVVAHAMSRWIHSLAPAHEEDAFAALLVEDA